METVSKRRCGICYRDVETDYGRETHIVFADDSVRCFAEPERADGIGISGFVFAVQPELDRRTARGE